jgi:hypothetical protein
MSFSGFFNKKARVALAATALVAGGAGVGYEYGANHQAPHLSNFTFNQPQGEMTEAQFMSGQLPSGMTVKPEAVTAEAAARANFTSRIDAMELQMADYRQAAGAAATLKVMPSLPAGPEEARAAEIYRTLTDQAVSFVSDLRVSHDLSGKDYKALLADYNARVGIDVSAQAGNYAQGVRFNQACQVGEAISQIFSQDDDDKGQAAAIGSCMQEAQAAQDQQAAQDAKLGAELGGGLLLGGLVVLPFRRRRNGPQAFKSRKPG